MVGQQGKSGGANRGQGRKSNDQKEKELVIKNKGGPLDHLFKRISLQSSESNEVIDSNDDSVSNQPQLPLAIVDQRLVEDFVDILEEEKEELLGLREFLLIDKENNNSNSDSEEEDGEQSSEEKENEDSEEDTGSDEDINRDEGPSQSQHSALRAYFEKVKNYLSLDVVKRKIAEGDLWHRAPDPICKAYASKSINLDRFLAPDLYILAPTLISDGIGRCIHCNDSNLTLGGWSHNPIARRIYSFNRSYFVIAKILECRNCKKSFSSANQQFLLTLPYHFQMMLPFFLSHRAGIDKSFFFYLRSSMLNSCGPTTLKEIIKENHYLNYDTKRVIYYSIADEFAQKRKQLKLAPLEIQEFGKFHDKTKYNEKVFSATYLTEQFIRHHEGIRPYYDSRMNMIPCKVGSFDDSFKAVKMIRYKSIKVFDAIGSFFAESGEVIGQWLRYTKSLDEIEQDLKDLIRPWRKIQIIYSDNECAEREVYERALDLPKGSSLVKLSRKLKPYSTDVKVILVENISHLNNVCTGIITRNIRSIGVDCEWVVSFVPGIPAQKVSLLQICDGTSAFLCRMNKIGAIPSNLQEIFESESILKVGRNIKKDISKLAEDYKCNLLSKGIVELGSFCKSVGYQNGRAGLSELASVFLRKSLEKRENIRLSNWEAENLSEEQKKYGAADSSVSLEIFQKALLYKGARLSLPLDSEVLSKEVYILPRTGFHVLAKGILLSLSAKDSFKAVVKIEEVFIKEGKLDNLSLSSLELPHTAEIFLNRLTLNRGFVEASDSDDEIEEESVDEPIQYCKGDPFHVLDRMYVKKHVFRKHFFEMFREAMFMMDKKDLENVLKVHPGEEFKKRVLNKWLPYVQKRIRRYIPKPSVLFERLSSVYEFFKDKKDSKGVYLLSKENRDDFLNILEHCRLGCLSDPEDIELYQKIGMDKNNLNLYRCIRGTNKAETYHQKLIRRFSAFRASPRFADALLSESRHRYNSRIAVRIRNVHDCLHYDQYLTEAIQLFTEKLYGRPLHPNWESSEWDFKANTGVARQSNFPRNILSQNDNPNLKNKELIWLSKKTDMKIPILPMHTKEEHELFVELISENKSINEMQIAFCQKANGVSIFPKATPQLERYVKKYRTFGKDALIFKTNLKDIRNLRDQLQEPIDLDELNSSSDEDEEELQDDMPLFAEQSQNSFDNDDTDRSSAPNTDGIILPSALLDSNPIRLIGTIANNSETQAPVRALVIPGTVVVGQIIHPDDDLNEKKKRKVEMDKRQTKRCMSTKNAPAGRTDMACGKEGCPGAGNRNHCNNMDYVLASDIKRRRRSRERSERSEQRN
jgi:hypothetical protein